MEFAKPSGKGFTIYSKSGCPYCDKAKKLLDDDTLTVIDCDPYLIDTKEKFLEFIKILSNKDHKTFPIIFKDNTFIGGYSDLLNCLKEDWNEN
jgi:glutaredoxin